MEYDLEDDGDMMAMTTSPIKTKVLGSEYTLKINRELSDSTSWQGELDILRDASPNDIIKLLINSPGGDLEVAIEFIGAITNSEALVIGELTGRADSAASMIYLCCCDFIVQPFTRMLIHTCYGAEYGNAPTNLVSSTATVQRMEDICTKVYSYFLTEPEIEEVLKGETIILNDSEIIERLEFRQEMIELEDSLEGEGDIQEGV